jgi:transposase-like protein
MLRVVNDPLQAKGLMMKKGTVVDATLISAPSSTKNADGERDPEMHQRIKQLEREVRELRQANEIPRKASAYFAQAELDRPFKK